MTNSEYPRPEGIELAAEAIAEHMEFIADNAELCTPSAFELDVRLALIKQRAEAEGAYSGHADEFAQLFEDIERALAMPPVLASEGEDSVQAEGHQGSHAATRSVGLPRLAGFFLILVFCIAFVAVAWKTVDSQDVMARPDPGAVSPHASPQSEYSTSNPGRGAEGVGADPLVPFPAPKRSPDPCRRDGCTKGSPSTEQGRGQQTSHQPVPSGSGSAVPTPDTSASASSEVTMRDGSGATPMLVTAAVCALVTGVAAWISVKNVRQGISIPRGAHVWTPVGSGQPIMNAHPTLERC